MARRRVRDSDDESEEDSAQTERLEDSDSPPAKRLARDSDEEQDDATDQGEELLDDAARSQALSFASQSSTGSADRAGIIEDLEINNFLCHTFLHIKFGPHVNFITGRNGSGKSAILAAIIVCLGGKATFTNRGSSMRDLVKKGQAAARVTLGIRNVGPEAFKPAEYGSVIFIERTIPREGPATLRLLRCTNPDTPNIASRRFAKVSTARDELSAIVEHFAILVDNPLALLTQDTAKQFLNSSAPTDKYRMFLRGTQLESISQNFQIVRERQALIREAQGQKRRELGVIREARRNADNKVRDLEKMRELEKQIEDLEAQSAWAVVKEQEETVHAAERHVQDLADRVAAARPELLEAEAELVEHNADRVATAAKHEQLVADRPALLRDVRAAQEAATAKVNERKAVATDMQHAEVELKRLRSELTRITQDIEAEARRVESGATSQLRAQRAERRRTLDSEIARIEHELSEAVRLQGECEERGRQLIDQSREQAHNSRDKRSAVDRARQSVESAAAASKNRLAAFGQQVPRILQEIDKMKQKHQFRGEVIGPMGQYITLRDQRWGHAVSVSLRTAMRAFIVTNYEDMHLLRRILRECRAEGTPVYKYHPQPRYDISGKVPDPSRFTSILSVIDVSNPLVYNALIDIAKIERHILLSNHREATSVLEQRPHNVLSVFLEDGARMSMSGTMLNHRTDDRGHGGGHGSGAEASYFVDNEQLQRRAQQMLSAAQEDLRRFEESLNSIADEQGNVKRQLDKHNADHRRLQRERNTATRERDALVDELAERDDSGQLVVLQDLRAEIEAKLKVLLDQYQDINGSYEAKQNEARPLQEAFKEKEAQLNQLERAINDARNEVDRAARLVNETTMGIAAFRERIRRAEEDVRVAEVETQRLRGHLAVVTEKASLVSETRPEDLRHNHARYEEELRRCRELLRRKEREEGTLVDARARLATLRAEETRVARALEISEKLVALLETVMETRQVVWLMNRTYMAMRSKALFSNIVEHRGFKGYMTIDHNKETIDIRVAGTDGSIRNSTQLSGGERSFSTMAFLLSLWEALDSPFRALDEYDVFMDEVNRKISTQLIIETARIVQSKQFILISPLETHAPLDASDVHVVRLADPVREAQA